MMRRINLLFWLVAIWQLGFSQITTNPAIPIDTKGVTITFDSSKDSRLGYFTSDLYTHTGVIISGNTAWQHVIGTWGNNTVQPKLTNKGGGIYELVISPSIISFYSVPSSELVIKLAFVFRSADGTKQTNDLFVNVYTDNLHVNISSPQKINVFDKNQAVQFTASSTATASLKLFLNTDQIATQSGSTISQSFSIPNAGNYWLKATATANNITVRDSVYVCVRENIPAESRPTGTQTGINYINDQTVTLSVFAPYKNNIFVVGDFNNWLPDNTFQMKKDGDYFWLTLTNLVPKKEYIFQYLIDGNIQVADAYTDKVSDPEDTGISASVYPGLIAYPTGKAVDRASVFQTAQTPFQWSNSTYTIPNVSKLSIYELLIRDFTTQATYKAVQEKLDYLKRLGVNTIELMPFSEFEGNDSWGYNPNFYFAPDKAYGTKEDLKTLIDECHKKGFIVIQDIVLNHAYGSNPMVKMYWNAALNRPAANNPWFNETSPNPVFSWGLDFNHESQATKDFVDRVCKYWLTEYKVDGFRFDFTKGFTNTPGDGSGYDASRIAILKRMADKIWEVNPKAFVILEHFATTGEEIELSSYKNGMLIWGNANNNFCEASMAYNESGKSDFSWASYQRRGFTKPGLVAYMESHDEQRQMYKTLTYGNSSGSYNTRELATALKRSQLSTAFFLSLAGPKMIWQFGEMGYDISIDQNGRVGKKPVLWNYLDDRERMKLFDVYSAMLRLRAMYSVFTSGTETLSLTTELKKIQLSLNGHYITLIGNFGMTEQSINPAFQHTGTWYEFFTGTELAVSNTSATISLKPGEYRLYSDQKLPAFKDLATTAEVKLSANTISIFPNPVGDKLNIQSSEPILQVGIYNLNGQLIRQIRRDANTQSLSTSFLKPGLYMLKIQTQNGVITEKLIRQ